jgi:hypothetical protein
MRKFFKIYHDEKTEKEMIFHNLIVLSLLNVKIINTYGVASKSGWRDVSSVWYGRKGGQIS